MCYGFSFSSKMYNRGHYLFVVPNTCLLFSLIIDIKTLGTNYLKKNPTIRFVFNIYYFEDYNVVPVLFKFVNFSS